MRCFILCSLPALALTSILRLPCVYYADFKPHHNTGVIITMTQVAGEQPEFNIEFEEHPNTKDVDACARKCMFHERCMLATFHNGYCNLVFTADVVLKERTGSAVLIPFPQDQKKIGPICEQDSPCTSEEEMCKDICDQNNQHTYECVPLNTDTSIESESDSGAIMEEPTLATTASSSGGDLGGKPGNQGF